MAKKDYLSVVYAVLSDMYINLQNGKDNDSALINAESYGVNDLMWESIIDGLLQKGFIRSRLENFQFTGSVIPYVKISLNGVMWLENNKEKYGDVNE